MRARPSTRKPVTVNTSVTSARTPRANNMASAASAAFVIIARCDRGGALPVRNQLLPVVAEGNARRGWNPLRGSWQGPHLPMQTLTRHILLVDPDREARTA